MSEDGKNILVLVGNEWILTDVKDILPKPKENQNQNGDGKQMDKNDFECLRAYVTELADDFIEEHLEKYLSSQEFDEDVGNIIEHFSDEEMKEELYTVQGDVVIDKLIEFLKGEKTFSYERHDEPQST